MVLVVPGECVRRGTACGRGMSSALGVLLLREMWWLQAQREAGDEYLDLGVVSRK